MIEPLLYVSAARFHRMQIRTDRCFRVRAAHEFLAHPLHQYGHRELLSLQPTLLVQSSEMLFRPPRQRLRSSREGFTNLGGLPSINSLKICVMQRIAGIGGATAMRVRLEGVS